MKHLINFSALTLSPSSFGGTALANTMDIPSTSLALSQQQVSTMG